MTTEDEGKIGQFLSRWFGRSYRTTLAGVVATGAAVVSMLPIDPKIAHIAGVIATLAAGGGLVIAKDARVSGKPSA